MARGCRHAGAAAALATAVFGQAEVHELGPRPGQHDVAGLQIAVHHASAMRPLQPIADFGPVLQDLLHGQRPLAQTVRQSLAFQVFHHQVINPILMSNIVERADVGMIQGRDRARFAVEPLLGFWVFRKV